MENTSAFEWMKGRLARTLIALAAILVVFFAVKTVGEIKRVGYIGRDVAAQNTITVQGSGEVIVVPDIAEVTYDVQAEATTVAAAQKSVTERSNAIQTYLESASIAKKDVKTVNYQIYPRYEFQEKGARICPLGAYCPPVGSQVLVGYSVVQSTQIKIRKIEDAGTVLSELGTREVNNVSGLNFTVEDEEAVKSQAREKAIADAREEAGVLTKQLGVRLVRVANFSESGNYPIYFKAEAFGRGGDVATTPAPSIEPGENKITSNVTITYEIR